MPIVDHVPATDATRPTMREAYARMHKLYESVYGAVDEKIWTNVPVTCGDSYSGFIPKAIEDDYNNTDPFVE